MNIVETQDMWVVSAAGRIRIRDVATVSAELSPAMSAEVAELGLTTPGRGFSSPRTFLATARRCSTGGFVCRSKGRRPMLGGSICCISNRSSPPRLTTEDPCEPCSPRATGHWCPRSSSRDTFFPGRAGRSTMTGAGRNRPITSSKSSLVSLDERPVSAAI